MKHVIENNGNEIWENDDWLHRDDDGPAIIWHDATEEWWNNGNCARKNNPAFININGKEDWKTKYN